MSPRPLLERRPFVGRGAELAVLHAMRRDLARQRGGVVLVAGNVGIGKSRLLEEFARSTRSGRTPLWVRAECLEAGGRAFGPIRRIVEALVGDGEASVDSILASALDSGALFELIEATLRRVARKRAVIALVEDIHWADYATLEFLAHIAARIATDRIAIVATYRDDEIHSRPRAVHALARIARPASTRLIELVPLDDATVFGLLGALLDGREGFDRALVREIVTRAEGNPFFVEELLRASLAGQTKTLPLSISGSVLARWATLSPADRRVLSHAAVIGYRFDPDLIAAILSLRRETVARTLRRAERERLIVEEGEPHRHFRFHHALIHETIAAQMLDYESRPLHARIAQLLTESQSSEKAVAQIAYHWLEANDERAVAAAEAAGDAAMALHAYADATAWFERALAIASDVDTQVRLCTRAALAANVQGDQLGSLAFYERALDLEVEAGHFSAAGELVRRVAGRLVYAGRKAEAGERLRAFMQRHEAHLTDLDSLLISGWPILMEFGGGGVREWRARFLNRDAVAGATGRDAWALLLLELQAHASVGAWTAWNDASLRLRPWCEEGIALERALSLLALGTSSAYLGFDLAFARDALDRVHAFCEEHRLTGVRKYVFACDVFERYLAGDVRAARRAAHLALADSDDANQRANVAIVGGLIGFELDDADLCELARSDGPRAVLRDGIHSHSDALCVTSVASALVYAGRVHEATALLEKAVGVLETLHGAQFLLPLAARHVVDARALDRIRELLAAIDAEDRAGAATRTMVEAILTERRGKPQAVEMALDAARQYRGLGWPILQANALELAGEPRAARALYLASGCVRNVRRLTSGRVRSRALLRQADEIWLTERERDVATLVSEGLGNVGIASRLNLSVKTVEAHLSRIFTRFGFRSRAQLAAHVAGELAGLRDDTEPRDSPDQTIASP